ncbi:hypothetical protein, partial [Salinibacter ruber]
ASSATVGLAKELYDASRIGGRGGSPGVGAGRWQADQQRPPRPDPQPTRNDVHWLHPSNERAYSVPVR